MYPQNIKAIFPFLGAFVKLFVLTSVFFRICFGEHAFWYVFHPMHCYKLVCGVAAACHWLRVINHFDV